MDNNNHTKKGALYSEVFNIHRSGPIPSMFIQIFFFFLTMHLILYLDIASIGRDISVTFTNQSINSLINNQCKSVILFEILLPFIEVTSKLHFTNTAVKENIMHSHVSL